MAKQRKESDETGALDLTNAPQQGDKPSLWSAEDMARLDAQNTELSQVYADLKNRFESLESRFVVHESQLAKLDLGEGILPAEIVDGVSPAQVYQSALQAAIIAISMANATGMLQPTSRNANIRRAFDTAEAALNESIRRSALRKKS